MLEIDKIATYLDMIPNMNRLAIEELLIDIANRNKDFKNLLAITHLASNRRILDKVTSAQIRPMAGNYINRILKLAKGETIGFSSYEYFILFTVIRSPFITQKIRDVLLKVFNYPIVPLRVTKHKETTGICRICSYPTSTSICSSCSYRNILFTEYRRESFKVPITYLNYKIRSRVNTDSYFEYLYKDWKISKDIGIEVVSFELQNTLYGSEREEYPLPFPDYQLSIV